MLLSTLKQFNWLDIFVLILLLRIGYVAMRSEFFLELFKFLGTILAIFLSLHYYIIFSDYIGSHIGVNNIPLEYLTSVISIVLGFLGYFIFVVLRKVFYRFMKMEAVPNLNKWGAVILGLSRGALAASLMIFIMVTSPFGYLKDSVSHAYSGKYIFKIAPAVYGSLWDGIASKFISRDKFNKAILDAPKNLEAGK
ncbi:MAG: CvpA family protein [Candidatus Omnitrophica bacterium]|nr:CvpA family protein [Candidatus Omnitrophota bacterium]MDD5592554.1 CvpA family protein [Candidatus Omnitrophota bacterium]